MPVHTTAVVGAESGVAALEKLITRVERAGERVVSVAEHLGQWVVVTVPGSGVERR